MEELIHPTHWIHYGQWKQPPLSGVFWCYWYTSAHLKKLIPQYTFRPTLFLDGHTFTNVTDQRKIKCLVENLLRDDAAELFAHQFENLAEDACEKHLALLHNTHEPLDYFIQKLFETYTDIVGLWWFSICFAKELEDYSASKNIVYQENHHPRKTWLERQHQEISHLDKIKGTGSWDHFLQNHAHHYRWFGTHHWMGEGYNVEEALKSIKVGPEKALTNSLEKSVSELLQVLTYWRTHLAEVTAKVLYGSRPKLQEIADQLGLCCYDHLLQLSPTEIKAHISEGKIFTELPEDFSHRVNGYGCIIEENGQEKMITGDELKLMIENLLPKNQHDTLEIKGTVACQGGIVQGKVKIILSPADFKKFTLGDILVASETSPDFVPLMKKARAIITDCGGVTSHAAIISRELKIPCITGTGFATRQLRDGQMVEIDSINGKIKVLN